MFTDRINKDERKKKEEESEKIQLPTLNIDKY